MFLYFAEQMQVKRAGKKTIKLDYRERSERKILHIPPNSIKLRSDYLFAFQKRTGYLFPAFSKSEYLFPKSASPPQSQIVVPLAYCNDCIFDT